MRQQRYPKRLNPRAVHLAGQGEPIVPPRIANGETAVVSRHDLRIEKIGVETSAHGRWFKVGTEINAPCEHSGPFQAHLQISGHIGIIDDPAIAVDDASEAASAGPDCRHDSAYARLSVGRRDGEFDRQIEATQRLGIGPPVDRNGIETGLPPGIQAIVQVGGGFGVGWWANGREETDVRVWHLAIALLDSRLIRAGIKLRVKG